MTAIKLRGVCPADDTEWCRPTDIDIPDGTFFVIRTTPSRAGRLARLVLGLHEPSVGTVEVLGLELRTANRAALDKVRHSVGSVLQPDGLLGTFTLETNLALAASVRGALHKSASREAASTMLARCGITDLAKARPGRLPEDARQIAALARALVCQPAMVVLDDPISAVKSRTAVELYRLCREMARTVVILTHRRNDTLYDLADVVALWDSEGFRTDAAA